MTTVTPIDRAPAYVMHPIDISHRARPPSVTGL